jgi:hypothetical protein
MAAITIRYGYSELDKCMQFFVNTENAYSGTFEKWIWFYMGRNNLSKSSLITDFCRIYPFDDKKSYYKTKEIQIVNDAEKTANLMMKFISRKAEIRYNKLYINN